MCHLIAAERVIVGGERLMFKRYLDDFPVYPLTNIWTDTSSGASQNDPKLYVVQRVQLLFVRKFQAALLNSMSCSSREIGGLPG